MSCRSLLDSLFCLFVKITATGRENRMATIFEVGTVASYNSEKRRINPFSLNSLVSDLLEQVKDKSIGAGDLLYGALIEFGYAHRSEYDEPHHLLMSRNYFSVSEGFPSLRADVLPDGVIDVKYSIRLDVCEPFAVNEKSLLNSLFD